MTNNILIIYMKNNDIKHNLSNFTLKYHNAFSLIELSIVLIIIGLLVAGITGGQSLIDSARARAVMNEVENYRRAIDIYFAANGKLPGDKLNNGKLGENSGNYYDGTDTKYSDCEDDRSCIVYIDLDKEGILDYSNVNPQYGKM